MNEPVVAITGMGLKTPIGLDLDTFWEGLCSGRSAGRPITSFDTSEHPVTFACELSEDFDVEAYVTAKDAAHLDAADNRNGQPPQSARQGLDRCTRLLWSGAQS